MDGGFTVHRTGAVEWKAGPADEAPRRDPSSQRPTETDQLETCPARASGRTRGPLERARVGHSAGTTDPRSSWRLAAVSPLGGPFTRVADRH